MKTDGHDKVLPNPPLQADGGMNSVAPVVSHAISPRLSRPKARVQWGDFPDCMPSAGGISRGLESESPGAEVLGTGALAVGSAGDQKGRWSWSSSGSESTAMAR